MRNQKMFTPNSIFDVKQYIFYDSDDKLVLQIPFYEDFQILSKGSEILLLYIAYFF